MFIQDLAKARIGEDLLPFECGDPSEIYLKKAEVELNETPDRRSQGLRQIKELINKDKHTKHIEFDDDFLVQFLRTRKYNISKAFSHLKSIANLKKKHPEVFHGFSYEQMSITLSETILTILPWRCHEGCTIIAAHLDNWNPQNFSLDDLKRAIALYLLQSLREPMTQINGFKIIIDINSNPIRHLSYMTPANLYLLYHGTQDCIPARYKEIHLVNDSLAFKAAWVIIKHFLSDKIKKRITFHSSSDTLQNFFPKAILPVDFGGDLENYDMYDWLKEVMKPEKLERLGGRPLQT